VRVLPLSFEVNGGGGNYWACAPYIVVAEVDDIDRKRPSSLSYRPVPESCARMLVLDALPVVPQQSFRPPWPRLSPVASHPVLSHRERS